MADLIDWRAILSPLSPALVRQIEDELDAKFADGWFAYERTLRERMRDMPAPGVRAQSAPTVTTLVETPVEEETPPTDQESVSGAVPGSGRAYPERRAPRGLWSRLVEAEAKAAFPNQLRPAEAGRRAQGRAPQYKLARSSLNTAIETLVREGRLRRDGNMLTWAGEQTPEPAGPNADDHGTAPAAQTEPPVREPPENGGPASERPADVDADIERRQLSPFSFMTEAAA